MLTTNQQEQITSHGLTPEKVNLQIERFKNGFPYIDIVKAATTSKGILQLDDKEVESYINIFEHEKKHTSFAKFVPASGAATRMFKRLFEYLNKPYDLSKDDGDFYSVKYFFDNIDDFAFIDDLRLVLLNESNLDTMGENQNHKLILETFLSENGLGYGVLPKGLLKFHKYEISARTAVEEHLVEAALYGASHDNTAKIHFTVSPQFIEYFKSHVEQVREEYESQFGVKYLIDYSIQQPYTDTIAVDENNNPIEDEEGNLIFRPAGHGALIENIDEIDNDIIFVKNIDNVVPDRLKESTVKYKKALAGILLTQQKETFKLIEELQSNPTKENVDTALQYINNVFCFKPSNDFYNKPIPSQADYLKNILNRPIRVCGMVKNEDEPGGGPFIVRHSDGAESLQIIESAQINNDDPAQKLIYQTATHFNPVDIVCGVKDHTGKKFDLHHFTDEDAGIITQKSIQGTSLKALELPGLWNGAMAFWNTIFVEVPLSTFNPVKEINDLLRKEHQQSMVYQ